jgi:hypothetical protein
MSAILEVWRWKWKNLLAIETLLACCLRLKEENYLEIYHSTYLLNTLKMILSGTS